MTAQCFCNVLGVLEQWSVGVLVLRKNMKAFNVLIIPKDFLVHNKARRLFFHYSSTPSLHVRCFRGGP